MNSALLYRFARVLRMRQTDAVTSLARSRLNTVLALAIPTSGFLYLMSSGVQSVNPPVVGGIVGFGVLWLAAVVRLNTLAMDRRSREVRDVTTDPAPMPRAMTPAYVVDLSLPVTPGRWTSVLAAPLELLAVAWAVPVMILLIMLPIGLVLVSALWLGRLILDLF